VHSPCLVRNDEAQELPAQIETAEFKAYCKINKDNELD